MNYSAHASDDLKSVSDKLARVDPHNADTLSLQLISNMLDDSVKFLLPESGDVGVVVSSTDMLKFVKMPYEIVAFEYSVPLALGLDPSGSYGDKRLVRCPKRIVLVSTFETFSKRFCLNVASDSDHLIVISVIFSETSNSWTLVPSAAKIHLENGVTLGTSDVDGKLSPGLQCRVLPLLPNALKAIQNSSGYSERELDDHLVLDLQQEIWCAVNALACINAKNVSQVEIPAPAKLNKKRAQSGKTPFSVYKVLDIFLGDARKFASGSGKRMDSAVRSAMSCAKLSSVRGHFKHRKTGIFWWSTFFRGNASNGVVVKDYNVKLS